MAVILVTSLWQQRQTSCCSILSGYPFWKLLKEHQNAENWVVSLEVTFKKKKKGEKILLILSFSSSFVLHAYISPVTLFCLGPLQFCVLKLAVLSHMSSLKRFFGQGKGAVRKCCWWLELNTSSLSPCTKPLYTPWLAHKLPHLTSLVNVGGAVNMLVLDVI